MKKLYILIFSLLLNSCYLSSSQSVIEADQEDVKKAFTKVTKELNVNVTEGPLDAKVYTYTGGIYYDEITVPYADFFFQKIAGTALNNTSYLGAVKFDSSTSNSTQMEVVVGTEAGDARADGQMLVSFTRQQLLFDKGLLTPAENEFKSKGTYIGLNTITPLLSAHYLMDDNPLICNRTKKYIYLQNGFGDLLMAGILVGASFEKDAKEKNKAIITGVSFGVIWRLLTLINLSDIDDYNEIAQTKYHLSNGK